MPTGSKTGIARCSDCGAPMSTSIGGHCAACLMRLATLEPVTERIEGPHPASSAFDAWLKVRGQRIGNHELLDEIARGGMGIVYRARQLNAGRTVALKVMLPQLLHLPGMLQRFRHEIEAAAQLDHPGILPIYEVGEHGGLPFFSMKFAEGGSLDRRVASLSGDWSGIATLVAKVAHAVEYAHRRGILHRDLKPANILFDARSEPMVADFGLAKFRALDRNLTLPAAALGSPNYMAPEQVSAEFGEIGPATDVYGLGAVLYELLTGQPPIVAEDALTTLRLVPTQEPQSGSHTRPGLPAELDAIALKCLSKKPGERYASAEELAQDLERWVASGQTLAMTHARSRRFRRWGLRAAAAVVALGAAAAVWQVAIPKLSTSRPGDIQPPATALLPRSIGVTQFANLGGSSDDDYLGSLVTDELLRDLRQIDSLRVIPFRETPTSAAEFQPAQLAARLGVDFVLAGDFARQQRQLKVRARLWDAKSHREIWQEAFDSPAEDIRDIRSQIATALITRLQLNVDSDVAAGLSDSLTQSPEAYALYVRARYLLRWRRPDTLTEAARLLRQAIAVDPNFARAHSALAYVYALWVPPSPPEGQHWPLAVQYARSASALDDTLGEPYAVLGDYYSIRGSPVEAESEFRRALERDPRDPAALHFYAIHLYAMGKLEAALEMERRSVASDASSPQPLMWLAMMTTTSGDYDEARRLWQKTDELGAARPLCSAVSRLDLGQPEFLSEWYRTNFQDLGVPPGERDESVLAAGVTDPTRRGPALEWLRRVETSVDPPFAITHYALLGDVDSAMRIARSYDLSNDFWYRYQLCNIWSPRTANMRKDARFGELMRRWKFVDYWQRYGPSQFCTITGSDVRCR